VVRLAELIMILELHQQGMTVSAIARRTGLHRSTVAKYLARGGTGVTRFPTAITEKRHAQRASTTGQAAPLQRRATGPLPRSAPG
jgi:IS30 family transposase